MTTGFPAYGYGSSPFKYFIFDTSNTALLLYILKYLDIKYVYVNDYELHYLETRNKECALLSLMKCLPAVFHHNSSVILQIPPLASPNSEVALCLQEISEFYSLCEYIWQDDSLSEGWRFYKSDSVLSFNFSSSHGICKIHAEAIAGKLSYVFYVKSVQIPISDYNMFILFKFRSLTEISYFILDVIYADGSVQRIDGYMLSTNWKIVSAPLERGKTIKYIRIGLTDANKCTANTSAIMGVLIDFIYICKCEEDWEKINTGLPIFCSFASIPFEVVDITDVCRFEYNTIFIPDAKCYRDLDMQEYLNWVSTGGTLVVLKCEGCGKFAELLGLSELLNETVSICGISSENKTVKFPCTFSKNHVVCLNNDVRILSKFITCANVTEEPFIVLKELGKGKLLYVDISPFFVYMFKSETLAFSSRTFLIEILPAIGEIICEAVNIPETSFLFERELFAKNVGSIEVSGYLEISLSSFLFTKFENFPLNETLTERWEKVIINGTACFLPTDSLSYVKLVVKDALIKLIREDDHGKEQLEMFVQNASFFVKDPKVHVTGSVIFSNFYDYSVNPRIGVYGKKIVIDGIIHFSIISSSEKAFLIDDLDVCQHKLTLAQSKFSSVLLLVSPSLLCVLSLIDILFVMFVAVLSTRRRLR